MTADQVFLGLGTIIVLAVGCQVAAVKLRIPALILLLPAGFLAGNATDTVNPDKLLGVSFTPLVGLAVAVILFEGGLDLRLDELEFRSHRVVRRLLFLGIPLTWFGAAVFAVLLFDMSEQAAVMLGAILIVSGPTVVGPILALAKPGQRVSQILMWEGMSIDPVGAVLGALTFQALHAVKHRHEPVHFALEFLTCLAVGLTGAAVGLAVLWLVQRKLDVGSRDVLATEVVLAVVVGVAAGCDVVRDDTGLIAAIAMGVVLANLPNVRMEAHRPFLGTVVQLVIGLLFVSISATVPWRTVTDVIVPSLLLVVCLIAIVRPVVAAVATAGSHLTRWQRAFVGWMDPRGIVAASTAATFAAPLAADGIHGADKLLAAAFLVIVGTVCVYGLTARPAARLLGLSEPALDGPALHEPAPAESAPGLTPAHPAKSFRPHLPPQMAGPPGGAASADNKSSFLDE